MKANYDYLVVGAGLYGAVFAYEAKKKGKTCLVIDKRSHIAGNVYCEWNQCSQIWRTHFSHIGQKNLGLCKPVCGVQQLYQFTGCCIQR